MVCLIAGSNPMQSTLRPTLAWCWCDGNFETWSSGNLEAWSWRTWELGNFGAWSSGNFAAWKLPNLETSELGNFKALELRNSLSGVQLIWSKNGIYKQIITQIYWVISKKKVKMQVYNLISSISLYIYPLVTGPVHSCAISSCIHFGALNTTSKQCHNIERGETWYFSENIKSSYQFINTSVH